jgi:hypothetical protein
MVALIETLLYPSFSLKLGSYLGAKTVTKISKLGSISDMLRATNHAASGVTVTVCNRDRE